MNNENLKFIETANGKIYYFLDRPRPDRPTIIFLHGLSANHTTWDNITAALQKFEINCLVPDLRGHGYSDMVKKRDLYRLSVFSQDLKQIIEKENLSKIILIGYSFGGYIALDYAIEHSGSLAGLILISTNHVTPYKYGHIKFLALPSYYILNFLAWTFLWQKRKKYYYYDQKKATRYFDSTFTGFTTMPISINLWMLAEVIGRLDFRNNIAEITCPTLIVRSQSDPFLSAREAKDMADKIKMSKIETLSESSHYLASRHQEKILEVLLKFLNDENLI